MAFKLTFTTDNAVFDEGAATETARILRHVAEMIEADDFAFAVRDINGNVIGEYCLDGE